MVIATSTGGFLVQLTTPCVKHSAFSHSNCSFSSRNSRHLILINPKFLCGRAPFQDGRTPGCLQWSDASIGGSRSAERCVGLASARSARRLPAAIPCDAAAVITRQPKSCEAGSYLVNFSFDEQSLTSSALCFVWRLYNSVALLQR